MPLFLFSFLNIQTFACLIGNYHYHNIPLSTQYHSPIHSKSSVIYKKSSISVDTFSKDVIALWTPSAAPTWHLMRLMSTVIDFFRSTLSPQNTSVVHQVSSELTLRKYTRHKIKSISSSDTRALKVTWINFEIIIALFEFQHLNYDLCTWGAPWIHSPHRFFIEAFNFWETKTVPVYDRQEDKLLW